MKKWKITLGGLHQKILTVLLSFLLILIASGTLITVYITSNLKSIVYDANVEQQGSVL